MRETAKAREYFRHFLPITTRWADNDVYGHVNNVVFYQWFDTVVNQFLISRGTLDIHGGDAIALVVETHCNYFAPVAFPEPITAGLCVVQLGKSSVRYEVGIFRGDESVASAQGHFVHVYVDRATRQPTPIPDAARALLQSIQISSG
ncbi:MAG: acyl-CoA thioesterase [Oxalobacteraceae bacterium]|jgi:acyl-CoA thioester hydrolase|nr:acyl-CoA thioesterase [Oxalobacteraceae bacterium]